MMDAAGHGQWQQRRDPGQPTGLQRRRCRDGLAAPRRILNSRSCMCSLDNDTTDDRPAEYPVRDVSRWIEVRDEPVGVTTKYWLRPPNVDDAAGEWLWKEVTVESTGLRRTLGHDWSERVAAEVARRLGVPAAIVELGHRHGRRGVLCRTFAPHGSGLALSNASELLPTVVDGYDSQRQREVPGYTLHAAFAVLDSCGPPPGAPAGMIDAASVFAGYLTLDAVIGNQDRHHDNWGVITTTEGDRYLAPAFDQASCLGYQETRQKKQRHLHDDTVASWARRGHSNHFEGCPNLVDHAINALTAIAATAAQSWLDQLASVRDDEWTTMLERVPDDRASQVDRSFATEILKINVRRVLDEWRNRRSVR